MPDQTHRNSHSNRLDRLVIGRVALRALVAIGIGMGLLFVPAQLQLVAEPGQLAFHEDGFQRLALALTPARLRGLQLTLSAVTLLGLAGWLAIRKQGNGIIGPQLHLATQRLRQVWQRLPTNGQRYALLILSLLMAARLHYLVSYPLSTDETASYDYFVRHGPRVILSYYPIPNNHLLYNLLAWPLSLTGMPPLLVMRLPTWVLAMASQMVTLALLNRAVGLRRALVIITLIGLAPLQVYYGAAGRKNRRGHRYARRFIGCWMRYRPPRPNSCWSRAIICR